MERQLLRLSSLGRHDVDVVVAVILGGKSDPFPVGRELAEELLPGMTGHAARYTSVARHQPEVSAVTEDDFVLGHVRKAHQPAFGHGLSERKYGEGELEKNNEEGMRTEHPSTSRAVNGIGDPQS